MSFPSIEIPPAPSRNLEREVGVSEVGSPLTRGSSIASSESIEQTFKTHLERYKISLEHDIEFIEKEIEAIPNEGETTFDALRSALKTRLATLQLRLERTIALQQII